MIGSSRSSTSHRESVRAPYASPQPAANNRLPEDASFTQPLVPFVPREFRNTARRDVTAVPATQQPYVTPAFAQPVAESTEEWAADTVAHHFGTVVTGDEPDAMVAEQEIEIAGAAIADEMVANESAAQLPWIEAFAADEPDAEETWPLGEAGKRLDELTESLSSMDASRARLDKSDVAADAENRAAESPLPMWNEDEWIDIMPTSMSAAATVQPEIADASPVDTPAMALDAAAPNAQASAGAELTAIALEALAQRIRAGEVQVPDAQPQVAQEALLAGVLASMLGWRQ